MSGIPAALTAHLATGTTTLCRIWTLTRRDGLVLGFTDHDRDLEIGGQVFLADHGLSAAAIQQSTGLSVDSSEAAGALTSELIRDEDVTAGRFDGAGVLVRLIDWSNPETGMDLFRGTIGEVTRVGGAFRAELRSLAEALNQPRGQLFQSPCSALLGDRRCGIDLTLPAFRLEAAPVEIASARVFAFADAGSHDDRWFERGRLTVLEGAAAGLSGMVKNDRLTASGRSVELWEGLGIAPLPGDLVRLEAGCDRRAETCRLKFNNINNFRGFPFIPGEDWLGSVPATAKVRDGGSLWVSR